MSLVQQQGLIDMLTQRLNEEERAYDTAITNSEKFCYVSRLYVKFQETEKELRSAVIKKAEMLNKEMNAFDRKKAF